MIAYVLVGFLSILLGILYVGFLTTHPLKMSRFLAGAVLTLVLIVAVIGARFSGSQVWLAAGLALAGFIVGYLVMARVVLSRADSRPVPALLRKPEDPGAGHTAVVYFTHGEPETFDPIGWLNQFREFDEQKIPFVPFFARPFFIYNLRKKYLAVGRSEHRSIHHKMIRSLEEAYRRDGDATTRFYLSFLDDNPRPDAALIQALNEGASRVVVCEVFLTVSNHTAEGKEQIAAVLEHFPDLPVEYTGPMYDSLTLQRMFVQRANRPTAWWTAPRLACCWWDMGSRMSGIRNGPPKLSMRLVSGWTCSSILKPMVTSARTSAWPGWNSRNRSPPKNSKNL